MKLHLCAIARFITLSLAVTILATGCHSSRDAVSGSGSSQSSTKGATGTLEKRFDTLAQSYGTWSDLRLPVTLNLNKPVNIAVSGTVTMVRDRNIHMSFKFFGMEVLSVYVTADSVFGTYKPNKLYVAESISKLMGDFPLTVGNVQDLLLGRAFVLGKGTVTEAMSADVKLAAASSGYSITPDAVRGIGYSFNIAKSEYVDALTVTPAGKVPITCNYGMAMATPAGMVATSASLQAGQKIDASLEWNLAKARWDEGNSREWTMPRGYKRVSPAQILGMVSNFSF